MVELPPYSLHLTDLQTPEGFGQRPRSIGGNLDRGTVSLIAYHPSVFLCVYRSCSRWVTIVMTSWLCLMTLQPTPSTWTSLAKAMCCYTAPQRSSQRVPKWAHTLCTSTHMPISVLPQLLATEYCIFVVLYAYVCCKYPCTLSWPCASWMSARMGAVNDNVIVSVAVKRWLRMSNVI